MLLSAGPLNQRVRIERRVVGKDSRGHESTSWQLVATVWASVTPARGRDFLAAAAPQATHDCTVLMRHRTDVLPTDRLVWKNKPLEIVGVPADLKGAGVALEILCTHGVRAGAPA